jgi:hypothetical protein
MPDHRSQPPSESFEIVTSEVTVERSVGIDRFGLLGLIAAVLVAAALTYVAVSLYRNRRRK